MTKIISFLGHFLPDFDIQFRQFNCAHEVQVDPVI